MSRSVSLTGQKAALGQATQFHPREYAHVILGWDSDDMTKNLVTALAKLRATMTVPATGRRDPRRSGRILVISVDGPPRSLKRRR